MLFLAKEADLLQAFLKTLSLLPLPYLKSLKIFYTRHYDEHYLTWFCRPNIPKLEKIIIRSPKKRIVVTLDSPSIIGNELPSLDIIPATNPQKGKITLSKIKGGYAAFRDMINECAIILELDSRYPFVISNLPGKKKFKNTRKSMREVLVLIVFLSN